MSIASAILALSPALYWKLDEPSGATAADSSGNARPGTYGANTILGKPGPESGTLAAEFYNTGGAQRASWLLTNGPWTMLEWCAIAFGGARSDCLYMTDFAAKGQSLTMAAAQGGSVQYGYDNPGVSAPDTGKFSPDALWHLLATTRGDGGATTQKLYLDSTLLDTRTLTVNALGAGNFAGCLLPGVGYVAHFAIWASALTAAQINGLYAGAEPLQVPLFPQTQTSVQQILADTTAILADTAAILASVRKTF